MIKLSDTFKVNLIQLRTDKGLTQADVAEALNITLRRYQKYEYGDNFPKPEMIEEIASFFGVHASTLFVGKSSKSSGVMYGSPGTGETNVLREIKKLKLSAMLKELEERMSIIPQDILDRIAERNEKELSMIRDALDAQDRIREEYGDQITDGDNSKKQA